MKYRMAALLGEIPIMVLPHPISNFVRFNPHQVYTCNTQLSLIDTILTVKMVYYFVSNVVSPSATIYVGKDKFESEPLSLKHLSAYISCLTSNCSR